MATDYTDYTDILLFHGSSEILVKFIEREQRAIYAPPQDGSLFVDEEVVPFDALAGIVESAKPLHDDGIDVTQKRDIFRAYKFLEFVL